MSTILGAPNFRNIKLDVTEVTTNYQVLATDFMIAVLDTTAPRTITLPLASEIPIGRQFIIKDETGGANVNAITVNATAPDNIDGGPGRLINASRGAIVVVTRPGGYAMI